MEEERNATIRRIWKQDIISRVAYLIGVPIRIFESEPEPPKLDIYKKLDANKPARIIRHLNIVKTDILHNYGRIKLSMQTEAKSIYGIPEYIPEQSLSQLSADGVPLSAARNVVDCLTEINRIISDRINNCKDLFPIWLSWPYLKDIFITPDGLTKDGIAEAVRLYYTFRDLYPYQMYINWLPTSEGNILHSDQKFVELLYCWHGDVFSDLSKVTDAGVPIKNGIYDFLDESKKALIIVDCENSDPYKLCATLRHLDSKALEKISKIVLYDDVHSASAWAILENYISTPVEHIMIERVKKDKSLVDIRLTAGACKSYYEDNVDSFILVSSDSDYWGLISSLPSARFLVMVERDNISGSMREAMDSAGIFYCYLDDFYSGDGSDLKLNAIIHEVYRYLDNAVQLNVYDMLDHAFQVTRAEMSEAERQQFFSKYIRPMHLEIRDNGDVEIRLQSR